MNECIILSVQEVYQCVDHEPGALHRYLDSVRDNSGKPLQ